MAFAFALSHTGILWDSFQRALLRAAANDFTPQESAQKCFPGMSCKSSQLCFWKSLVFVIIKATGIFLWEGVYVTQGRIISFIHTNENFRGKLKNLLSHHTKLGSQVFDAYSSSCLKGQIPERMAMKSKRLGFILCSLLFWFDSPV